MTPTNDESPRRPGQRLPVTNHQEGNNIMSIVTATTDTDARVPCTTYAWCQGHGGTLDEGERPDSPHIGPDTPFASERVSGWICPQVDPRDGTGIAVAFDCDIVLKAADIDDFQDALTALLDAVREHVARYPEVSA